MLHMISSSHIKSIKTTQISLVVSYILSTIGLFGLVCGYPDRVYMFTCPKNNNNNSNTENNHSVHSCLVVPKRILAVHHCISMESTDNQILWPHIVFTKLPFKNCFTMAICKSFSQNE